jgi:hypothetical protein
MMSELVAQELLMSTFDELRESLAAVFLDAAKAAAKQLQRSGLPFTHGIDRTIVTRTGSTGWTTETRSESINTLAIWSLARRAAPWLTDEDTASAFDCAAMVAESARETLPFWAPFAGRVWPLLKMPPDDAPDTLPHPHDLDRWVAHYIMFPALQQHLETLPGVDQADETAANAFAEEVLRVAHDSQLRYLVRVPLSGVDLASTKGDAIMEDGVCIRRLSDVEQGAWLDHHGRFSRGSLLDVEPPLVEIELRTKGPRTAQHMPDAGMAPYMAAGLQLHGHHPAGSLGVQYSDPLWIFPGTPLIPMALPPCSTEQSVLTADDFLEAVRTANLLKNYDLKQPRSPKELALHRFIAGMARENGTDAVLDFTIALEALLLPYDEAARHGDLGYRFRMHGAHYLTENAADRHPAARQLGDIYETRSRLVHGGKYPDRALITTTRHVAEGFARYGLLRAVLQGFPTAAVFNRMILGSPD